MFTPLFTLFLPFSLSLSHSVYLPACLPARPSVSLISLDNIALQSHQSREITLRSLHMLYAVCCPVLHIGTRCTRAFAMCKYTYEQR